MDFRELATLDLGAWHSARYAGEAIATLHSVAAFTQLNGIASNIEIKPHTGTDEHPGQAVARLAGQLWDQAAITPRLSSFSDTTLGAAPRQAPKLPRPRPI